MSGLAGLRSAVSTFTVVPVPARWHRHMTAGDARAMLAWLPLVGLAAGAVAALPAAGVLAVHADATLLAAALAVAALALLTRGLHLDGLADTADGLGSRRPPDETLQVMGRSDIGPFGVVALVAVMSVDVAALTHIAAGGRWNAVAALAVAAATGRGSILHASGRRSRAARPGGFGALVVGGTSGPLAVAMTIAVLGAGAGAAALVPHGSVLGWPAAQAGALVVSALFRAHAARRIGGVTGDVFGALVELATAATLVGIALT